MFFWRTGSDVCLHVHEPAVLCGCRSVFIGFSFERQCRLCCSSQLCLTFLLTLILTFLSPFVLLGSSEITGTACIQPCPFNFSLKLWLAEATLNMWSLGSFGSLLTLNTGWILSAAYLNILISHFFSTGCSHPNHCILVCVVFVFFLPFIFSPLQ